MDLITTTADLAAACERLSQYPTITVDTEFLRETTFYPLLCVVQMASPDEAVVVDALAEKIRELMPLREPFYAQSDIVVRSRDEPHDTIVDEIMGALGDRPT